MNKWRDQINDTIVAFLKLANEAGIQINAQDISIDFLHKPLLPAGKVAVYGFHYNDTWLKIGKAGPKSHARYTSQHYHPKGARSTLARSPYGRSRDAKCCRLQIR